MRTTSTVTIVEKSTGQVIEVSYQDLGALEGSVVRLPIGPDEAARFADVGGDLVITLRSGQEVVVPEFFVPQGSEAARNELVLQDSNDVLWWGQYDEPWSEFAFAEINAVGDLVASGGGGGFGLMALAGLGVAGIVAAASGGGGGGGDNGGDDNGNPVPPAPEPDPPAAPVVEQANAEGVGGTAQPGMVVTLRDAQSATVATSQADTDGNWFVAAEDFPDGSTDGFEGSATVTDDDGNESEPTPVGPVDGAPPAAPVVEQENAEGVGGTAEPDSQITLRDNGAVVATTHADASGDWFIPADDFPGGETDGFEGSVTATDAAGNESDPADVGPVDGAQPDAASVMQADADGVGGTAAGSEQVEVRNSDGGRVALAPVDSDGHWFVPANLFPGGTTEGFEGEAIAIDAAGNQATPTAIGPLEAPPAPDILQQDLLGIGGEAQADTEIQVRDQAGDVVATTTADDQGLWFVSADDLPDALELIGFTGTAIAINAAGFASPPSEISLAPIWAFDLSATPALVIDGVTATEDLGELSLPGTLLGIGSNSTDETSPFEVPDGSVGALSFNVSSGSVLSLLDQGYEITLLQQQGTDFVSVGTVSNDPGLLGLDLLTLLGSNDDWQDEGIPAGTYKLELSRTGGVELLSGGVTVSDITLNLFDPDDLDNVGVEEVQPHGGNLLTDEGADGLSAQPGDPDTVLSVNTGNGFEVPDAQGLEIQGQFGVLTVQENGDYEYVPAAAGANIGQEERFGFRLEHPGGDIAEAELVVEIGFVSDEVALQQLDEGETISLMGLEGSADAADDPEAAEVSEVPALEALLQEAPEPLLDSGSDDLSSAEVVASERPVLMDPVMTDEPDAVSYSVI